MLPPPGPTSSPTMMSTMPARIPPRISVTMPAITKIAAMIHRRVHPAPDAARRASIIVPPFFLSWPPGPACSRHSSGLSVSFLRTRLGLRIALHQQLLEQGPVVDHGLAEVLGLGLA